MASARSRIAFGVLAVAVVLAVALFRLASSGSTEDKVRQGREKLLLDDSKSLREATGLFTDAARDAPGQAEPEAERAFALLLQASAHKDLAAIAMDGGDSAGARRLLERVVRDNPRHDRARWMLSSLPP